MDKHDRICINKSVVIITSIVTIVLSLVALTNYVGQTKLNQNSEAAAKKQGTMWCYLTLNVTLPKSVIFTDFSSLSGPNPSYAYNNSLNTQQKGYSWVDTNCFVKQEAFDWSFGSGWCNTIATTTGQPANYVCRESKPLGSQPLMAINNSGQKTFVQCMIGTGVGSVKYGACYNK